EATRIVYPLWSTKRSPTSTGTVALRSASAATARVHAPILTHATNPVFPTALSEVENTKSSAAPLLRQRQRYERDQRRHALAERPHHPGTSWTAHRHPVRDEQCNAG